MNGSKAGLRIAALAASLTLLAGSPVFAQGRTNQGYANRTVDGTVAAVSQDRNGERVRLTNGMDVVVPNTITATNQGRRYGAATLQPGDVVRLNVYSRQGDGRDAQVRSMEIVQRNSRSNSNYNNNGQRLSGTVVSYNRRAQTMVMRTDNGQTLNVNLSGYNGLNNNNRNTNVNAFRRGDRITISGRTDRGVIIADDVRMIGNNSNRR